MPVENAQKLLEMIEARPVPELTERDVYRAHE
jgi:hypothetical protein